MAGFFRTSVEQRPRDFLAGVTIVPQQRGRISNDHEMRELTASINRNGGLIHQIHVLRFDTKIEAVRYRKYFIKLYGGKAKNYPIKQASDDKFYVLVAGHRRHEAMRHTDPEKVPYVLIGVMVATGPGKAVAAEAAMFQADENLSVRPPPVDEALSIIAIANVLKMSLGRATHEEIAERTGRSVSTIAAALKFGGLPEYVRREVVEDRLQYGKAVMLSKMCSEIINGAPAFPEEIIRGIMKTCILEGMTEGRLSVVVDELIKYVRDLADGTSFSFGEELSIGAVYEAGAKRMKEKHRASLQVVLQELLGYYRKLGEDRELAVSPLGGIHEANDVTQLILKVAEYLEHVANVAKLRKLVSEQTAERAFDAVAQARLALQ